jgi:hypothetical protein
MRHTYCNAVSVIGVSLIFSPQINTADQMAIMDQKVKSQKDALFNRVKISDGSTVLQ